LLSDKDGKETRETKETKETAETIETTETTEIKEIKETKKGDLAPVKIRVKFTKRNGMNYLGHLDVMRYFQKVIRRAEIPIAFSAGYNPHMIMSFASPLG
jgi:hypothetical protein